MDDAVKPLDKLAPALVALQADLKPVAKDAANPFFKSKYADLPAVLESIQPLLAAHKLAVSQWPTTRDGKPALRIMLMHESGQYLEDTMDLLLAKDDPQGQGSAITYARRYSLMSVLGLVADEDDDGNAASNRQPPKSDREQMFKNAPAASPNKAASEKQRGYLAKLAHQKGKDNAWIDSTFERVKTSADASAVIDQLNKLEDA